MGVFWRGKALQSGLSGWLTAVAVGLLSLAAACSSPTEVTSGCKVTSDCPNGFVCQSAVCIDPNVFSCNSGDNAYCEGLLVSGQWKTAELTTCQSAQCVSGSCQVVAAQTGSSCEDGDGLSCTSGSCTAEAVCTAGATIAADRCVVAGACIASGTSKGTAAADLCWQCDPTKSQTDWSPKPSTATCPDDGIACTQDRCDGAGSCKHATLQANTCLIDSTCVAAGGLRPSNSCESCQPDKATTAWTAVSAGTSCKVDDLACTLDACDGKGSCKANTIASDSCLIAGSCIAAGTLDPANPCAACQPEVLATVWTPLAVGATCTADDLPCTVDGCDGKGACKADVLTPDSCLVSDGGEPRCMAAGEALSDASNCQICNPALSTTSVSAATNGAACIAGYACLTGQCNAGSCVSDGPKAGSCFVSAQNLCVQSGQTNPANDCEVCQTDKNPLAWSAKPATTACGSDDVLCTVDTCDGAGKCLHTAQNSNCNSLSGPCAVGLCDAKLGCYQLPLDATVTCDSDGITCVVETCDGAGKCKPAGSGQANNSLCNDNIGCTTDACSPSGCVFTPVQTVCDDGNVCTTDVCDLSADCTYTNLTATSCDSDDLPCTEQLCDAGQCELAIDASSCVIADVCIAAGTTQSQDCQICDPTQSATAWTLVGSGKTCATDGVACTVDTCDNAGSCQHTTTNSLCDDNIACTADACDATAGCSNTDACPWGHTCDSGSEVCLSSSGAPVLLSASGSSDPAPTNAVLGSHLTAAGKERTWVLWQSQSCATVAGGQWAITQPAALRAMALDPQVADPADKLQPPTWTLPTAELFGGSPGVCQGFAAIAPDPQVPTQAWLAWLEAKPGDLTTSCLNGNGQGGVFRLARLDANAGPSFAVAGNVCPAAAANGPLFLTQGFAVLDGSADLSDPALRGVVSVRPQGSDLANWITGAALRSGAQAGTSATLNSLFALSNTHPALVDLGSSATADERYLAVSAALDEGNWSLWAHSIKATGAKGALASWTSDTAVTTHFTGATAVCSLDAAVLADGTLGVAVVTRKAGKDEVVLIERDSTGTVSAAVIKSQNSFGDCRVGIASAAITTAPGGFTVVTYQTVANLLPFVADIVSYGDVESPVFGLSGNAVSTTDNASAGGPVFGLGSRGLVRPLWRPNGVATTVQEMVNELEIRGLYLRSTKL